MLFHHSPWVSQASDAIGTGDMKAPGRRRYYFRPARLSMQSTSSLRSLSSLHVSWAPALLTLQPPVRPWPPYLPSG